MATSLSNDLIPGGLFPAVNVGLVVIFQSRNFHRDGAGKPLAMATAVNEKIIKVVKTGLWLAPSGVQRIRDAREVHRQ
jgi:hypothetical protein